MGPFAGQENTLAHRYKLTLDREDKRPFAGQENTLGHSYKAAFGGEDRERSQRRGKSEVIVVARAKSSSWQERSQRRGKSEVSVVARANRLTTASEQRETQFPTTLHSNTNRTGCDSHRLRRLRRRLIYL